MGGCAIGKRAQSATEYDLGPSPVAIAAPPTQTALPMPPAISLAEVLAPVWLDTPMMYYRLAYINDLQPRQYGGSRWTMPPAQLFAQRLKSRLAQSGSAVLSASDGASNVPLLRLEADDFTQNFSSPGQSVGRVAIRASLFNVRTLIAYKSFAAERTAATADANGGALALAAASDAVIADIAAWLSQVPLKK
jgi:cholesterol transport system auxiliary component